MSVVVNKLSSVNVILNLCQHLKAGRPSENVGVGAELQHSIFSDYIFSFRFFINKKAHNTR